MLIATVTVKALSWCRLVGTMQHPCDVSDVAEFLNQLKLSHNPSLTGENLCQLLKVLENQGRVALLARLKSLGFAKLVDRQALANALARALREGSFDVPEVDANTMPVTWDFDPFTYAEVLVPAERALKGRARRPVAMGLLCDHYVLATSLLPPWPARHNRAVFAAGCFWGLEKGMWRLPGVHSTSVGYTCGYTPHPTYSEVCTGLTGHTEGVRVVYDPTKV